MNSKYKVFVFGVIASSLVTLLVYGTLYSQVDIVKTVPEKADGTQVVKDTIYIKCECKCDSIVQ